MSLDRAQRHRALWRWLMGGKWEIGLKRGRTKMGEAGTRAPGERCCRLVAQTQLVAVVGWPTAGLVCSGSRGGRRLRAGVGWNIREDE